MKERMRAGWKAGWYVQDGPSNKGGRQIVQIAHYYGGLKVQSACGDHELTTHHRLWSVFQDVGRLPLCVHCKEYIARRLSGDLR